MATIPHPCVEIQTTELPQPSVPPWFAECILMASYLRGHGVLDTITSEVRLVRGRFGQYEVIDFLAVLFGYAVSGERTLQAFFDRLQPFADPFMALFERGKLPHRSTLSRFLTALDDECLDALRTRFVVSSFTWGWTTETIGGLWDRAGHHYLVFAIDGTREVARQRGLPSGSELPPAHRRLDALCAPGYLGHRHGDVVRTRTTILQMPTRQWLGSFGGRGNGNYRGELQSALAQVSAYLAAWNLPIHSGIVRVDGHYGDEIVMAAIIATGLHLIVRKRGYAVLAHPRIQAALAHGPTATITSPESQVTIEVFAVPDVVLEEATASVRLILTRRAWNGEPITSGNVLGTWIYEQFVTTLPHDGFLATDILELYHGRGAFAGTLADEDREGDPDRWCSFAACGQECWQVIWQWVWNLRLACGVGWTEAPLRSLEWAPPSTPLALTVAIPTMDEVPVYGPLEWSQQRGRAAGRLSAAAFPLQADGMLRCPNGVRLWHSETQQENAFTQRLVFTARDDDCAPCPLRASCLGRGASGKRGRRVSAVRHRLNTAEVLMPLPAVAADAICWKDVAGRQLRRSWMAHWRSQTVTLAPLLTSLSPPLRPPRAARSHRRLSWRERVGRNTGTPLPLTRIDMTGVAPHVLTLLQA